MKNHSLVLLVCFLLAAGLAAGSGSGRKQEQTLQKKAHELSYEGQLEKANELLGQPPLPTGKGGKADEGWDMTSLMLTGFWSILGMGYFMFGRKQSRAMFLLCGIGLCVFPMFVSGIWLNVGLGLVMAVAPFRLDF